MRHGVVLFVAWVAVLQCGHGAPVLWVCPPTALAADCDRLDPVERTTAASLAGLGDALKKALLRGHSERVREQLAAVGVRTRSPLGRLGMAEFEYWSAQTADALPSVRSKALVEYSDTLRLASEVLDGRLDPAALWRSGVLGSGDRDHLGSWHEDRAATLAAGLTPRLGSTLARRQAKRAVQGGDRIALARALLKLSALAARDSQRKRAQILAARAARLAALHGDGSTAYVALAQMADLGGARERFTVHACDLVPQARQSVRVGCWIDATRSALRRGAVSVGLALYGVLAPLKPSLGPPELARLATAALPPLAATGRWLEFETLARDGIRAALRVNRRDDASRMWLIVAAVARARGEPLQAQHALAQARRYARTEEVEAEVEVATARYLLERGERGAAAAALTEARASVARSDQLPLDAALLASDLGLTGDPRNWDWNPDRSEPLGILLEVVETAREAGAPSSAGSERLDKAATRAMAWARRAGGTNLQASLAGTTDLWDRVAQSYLQAGAVEAALAASERGDLHDGYDSRLRDLRASIPDDVGVLVYRRVGRDLYWWALDATAVRSGRAGTDAQTARRIVQAHADMMWSEPGRSERIGRLLTQILIVPPMLASNWAETKQHLIMVPGPDLAGLPFSALPWRSEAGDYLDDHFVISRAASLEGLLRASQAAPGRGHRIAFVPRAGRDAASEARRFVRFGGEAFLGSRATRRAFVAEAPGASVLHYGGHTAYSDDGQSRLTFAGGPSEQAQLSGLEIARMDLRGAVVVLLGCETAHYMNGRGAANPVAASVATAFLRAGSRGVAATLWPLSDRLAADVARRLYESTEVPTARAVSELRRRLRAEFPHEPHRWAGLVWFGAPAGP